jgi:pimeloyl-ACP methyl ester carboxylesterase
LYTISFENTKFAKTKPKHLQTLHSKILGKGTSLLIFHGFLGSGDNWISLGRRFAAHFEVHLIDLRNHGRSFHDDEMDFEVMCEDVIYYCKKHQLEKLNIIGHSMGGKLGMYLATQQPNLIHKLIVADIAPKQYKPRHDFILNALQAVDFSIHKTRNEIEEVLTKFIGQKAIRQFLLKNIYRKKDNNFAFRFNLSVFVEMYDNIVDGLLPHSQFEGETLFLKGEFSDYILEEDTALIQAHFPKSKITIISNSGHWLHAEQADDFLSHSLSFLL